MDTFQLITIKSSDPFIRGLQYGQQAEALIHLGIEGYQRHFSKTLDLTGGYYGKEPPLSGPSGAGVPGGAGGGPGNRRGQLRTSGGHPGSELQV